MDEIEFDPMINVRIVIEKPNKSTIDSLCTHLMVNDVVVESSNDRSINILGEANALENALGMKIEISDQGANIVSGPDINIEAVNEPINAYIPRKPIFFN